MNTQIFHIHALSALHVGVGQAIGVVDLPIMRARATNLPIVPGSAIKGVLRDEFAGNDHQQTLFGPENISDSKAAHAGAIALGDAHLLILPVRSLAGIVAFVTCPFVLSGYAQDQQRANPECVKTKELRNHVVKLDLNPETCMVGTSSVCKANAQKVVLEDLDLSINPAQESVATIIAQYISQRLHPGDSNTEWQALFAKHFVIVTDDVFSFLADTATEVRARIRIKNETGIVEEGALWYEENLPAESVLWGAVGFGPARNQSGKSQTDVHKHFTEGIGNERTIQIGGKATVGRGLVRFIV